MLSVLLYRNGQAIWHQGHDGSGDIDVAVIQLDRDAMPPAVVLQAFTPAHLRHSLQVVKVGTPLLVVGYPLGFHDTLHHLLVVRQAFIASSFGLRFQGQGYFLTDARTHRGTSGAPVVMQDDGWPEPTLRGGAWPELRLVRRHPAHPHGPLKSLSCLAIKVLGVGLRVRPRGVDEPAVLAV